MSVDVCVHIIYLYEGC